MVIHQLLVSEMLCKISVLMDCVLIWSSDFRPQLYLTNQDITSHRIRTHIVILART